MADQGRQIGFEQLGIGAVLRSAWLQVPLHQREYSWTDREVSDLFHDIARAMNESASEYFLGSIVTIPREGGALEVVDGQQRLATTAILLSAIRDFLTGRTQDAPIVEDINGILSAVDRKARQRRSRLRLNTTDHAYFEKRVQDAQSGVEQQAASHRLIDKAAKLARQHVEKLVSTHDPADHGDVLNRWIDFLEHSAIVVLLKVPSAINAYRMFETLNDRGLRTSQSDLVKNYLFGEAADRINEAQQRWAGMRAVLESFEDDDITINYLRQMLISLYGPVRENDVYDTVARKAKGPAQSIEFLSLLEAGASDYAAILNPQHEKWNTYPSSVRRSLVAARIVRVKAMRPLMLAVARKFKSGEADKALRVILNASVRLVIAGGAKSAGRSGTVETALAKAAMRVSGDELTTAAQVLTALKDVVPKDPQFEGAFRTATISRIDMARYYLRCLEHAKKGDADPCLVPNEDAGVVNLEHVLPRKPGDNWPAFTQEDAEASYRRIGNMALLAAKTNSDLKSAPFTDKAAAYKEAPFELTRAIADLDAWTMREIDDRQEELAKLAKTTWPLALK